MLCVPLNCKTFNKMPSIENLDSEPKMANKVFFPSALLRYNECVTFVSLRSKFF